MIEQALLDTLRDDPGDSLAHLALADWFEEDGQPERAEFLRLAVRIEQLPASSPKRKPLLAEYADRHERHRRHLLGPCVGQVKVAIFRGAILDRVELHAPTLDSLDFLLRSHPVRELVLPDDSLLPELARSGRVGHFRVLTINASISQRSVRRVDAFLDAPGLRLTGLNLSGSGIDDYLAGVIATARGLAGLRALRLTGSRMSDAGLVRLLRPGVLPYLEDLNIQPTRATSLGLAQLFAPHRAHAWKALAWHSEPWADADLFDGLARCQQVERLCLPMPRAFGEAAPWRRLASLPALRELHLLGTPNPPLLEVLSNWPGLARLERLSLLGRGLAAPSYAEQVRDRLIASPHRNPNLVVSVH